MESNSRTEEKLANRDEVIMCSGCWDVTDSYWRKHITVLFLLCCLYWVGFYLLWFICPSAFGLNHQDGFDIIDFYICIEGLLKLLPFGIAVPCMFIGSCIMIGYMASVIFNTPKFVQLEHARRMKQCEEDILEVKRFLEKIGA